MNRLSQTLGRHFFMGSAGPFFESKLLSVYQSTQATDCTISLDMTGDLEKALPMNLGCKIRSYNVVHSKTQYQIAY